MDEHGPARFEAPAWLWDRANAVRGRDAVRWVPHRTADVDARSVIDALVERVQVLEGMVIALTEEIDSGRTRTADDISTADVVGRPDGS